MDVKRIKITAVLLLMPAAAGLLLVTQFHPHRNPEAPPNIDALTDSLRRSADAAMPAPQVTNEKVILLTAKYAVPAETDKVIALASKAGGTAIRSATPAGEPEVLASLPSAEAGKYVEKITGKPSLLLAPVRPGENELIDVVITSGTAP